MRRLLLFTLTFGLCFQAYSQRKSVGLVLSGGGAKGFAHIGVIRVMDSLGIPIDYVGGTSMGAIVGGLTAIGYTPDQIEEEILQVDWTDVMQQKPKRKFLKSYEKSARERYFLTLELTKDFNLEIPGGINNGQKITGLLSNLTYPYHGDLDFNKDLEIPFFCIATELNTGKERVLNSGELYKAMRASMSIPSLFSPYKLDGKYLIDGGTVNNFPADHIQEMGADIIIGVDVQTTFSDSISDPTLLKVLEKTGMYVNAMTTKKREQLCDFIVRPDMNGYSVTTFEKATEIIKAGERAARAHMDELLALKAQLGEYHYDSIQPYQKPDSLRFDSIVLKGVHTATRTQVVGTMGLEAGSYYTQDEISDGLQNVYGTGWFKDMEYVVEDSSLYVNVVEKKSIGDVRLGLRYDPDLNSALLINYTTRQLLLKGAILSFDLGISESPRARLLYFWDNGVYPGLGISARYLNFESRLFVEGDVIGRYRQGDLLTELFVASSLSNNTMISAGVGLQFIHFYAEDINLINILGFSDLYSTNTVGFVEMKSDTRDRASYGRKGHYLDIGARVYAISVDEDFNSTLPVTLRIDYIENIPFGQRYTQNFEARLGMTIGTLNSFPYLFNLGGLGQNYINNMIPFYGYSMNQHVAGYIKNDDFVAGNQMLKLGWDHQYEIFTNNYIRVGANGALLLDDFYSFVDNGHGFLIGGFALEYGVHTIIGPIGLSAHKNFDSSDWLGFVNIGFWF
ncbi:MAG: patatin-like phospholipase family protein [Schleiferiaceae bacterium]